MWPLIGNKRLVQFLENQIKNNSVFHAYLFLGPASLGKFTLAKFFAQALLSEENVDRLAHHPDFLLIENKDSQLSIEVVRQVERQLSFLPALSNKKVVVFEEASRLTLDAQNALLKTLEEPPEYAVIILVSQRESLLPTILSRCLRLSFQPVSPKEIEKAGFSPFLAHLTHGQVGRLLKDPLFEQKWEKNLNNLAGFFALSLKEKMEYTKNLKPEDLFFWISILKDVLYFKINPSLLSVFPPPILERIARLSTNFEIESIVLLLEKLEETENLLLTNVNQKLLLENLALSL